MRLRNKKGMLAAAAGLALTAGAADAAVISVDFQNNSNGNAVAATGDQTGSFVTGETSAWNVFNSTLNGGVGGGFSSGALVTRDSSATLNTVEISILSQTPGRKIDTRIGSNSGSFSDVTRDGWVAQDSDSVTNFEITGLIPNNTYDLKYFTTFKTNGGDPTAGAFVSFQGDPQVRILENAVGDFSVTADGTGDITGFFTSGNQFRDDSIAGLEISGNFVSAAAIPEPSSTALLGLGGIALLLRRRK